MVGMLLFLNWLEFTAESVLIPGLAPHRNGHQIFGIEFLLIIPEIEEDLAIILAKIVDHEHDLEGLAERVFRKGERVKQFAKVCLV